MTGEPLWNEVAAEKIVTVMRFSVPKNAGRRQLMSPRSNKKRVRKKISIFRGKWVVHNDPVNLMSYVTMVFSGSSVTRGRKPSTICWRAPQRAFNLVERNARARRTLCAAIARYLLLATLEKAG